MIAMSTTAKTLTVRVDLPWSVVGGSEPDLGAHGVPVIDYPAADLEHELSQLGIS